MAVWVSKRMAGTRWRRSRPRSSLSGRNNFLKGALKVRRSLRDVWGLWCYPSRDTLVENGIQLLILRNEAVGRGMTTQANRDQHLAIKAP
jgi:hypothetical protein